MTQEEKRIKIAEKCGFKSLGLYGHCGGKPVWESPDGFKGHVWAEDLPDYFNDLNACAEMVEVLVTPDEHDAFVRYLCVLHEMPLPLEALPLHVWWYQVNATAAQRAEAFGRTLNLW